MNPTKLQSAIKLEDVPKEKWHTMVARTIIGLIFLATGFALLQGSEGIKLYLSVGLIMIGATTWSSQIVTKSLLALVEPFRAVWRIVKNGGAPE
jgi:hypothetical protein